MTGRSLDLDARSIRSGRLVAGSLLAYRFACRVPGPTRRSSILGLRDTHCISRPRRRIELDHTQP